MPTRHAGSFWKNAMTCRRFNCPANKHLADTINTVHLKDRLSDIKTDCRNRLHAWLLRIVGASTGSTSMALACRGGAVHSIKSGHMHRSKNFVIYFVPSATPGSFDAVKSHSVTMCSIFARLLGLIGKREPKCQIRAELYLLVW